MSVCACVRVCVDVSDMVQLHVFININVYYLELVCLYKLPFVKIEIVYFYFIIIIIIIRIIEHWSKKITCQNRGIWCHICKTAIVPFDHSLETWPRSHNTKRWLYKLNMYMYLSACTVVLRLTLLSGLCGSRSLSSSRVHTFIRSSRRAFKLTTHIVRKHVHIVSIEDALFIM